MCYYSFGIKGECIMKKAIKIAGIVAIIIWGLFGIFEVVYGASLFNDVKVGEVLYKANIPLAIGNIILGVWLLSGVAFSIVDIIKCNSEMPKTKGIILGVVSAVLGAVVPGVLFVIDSVKTRK